jgi:Isochorismatase family
VSRCPPINDLVDLPSAKLRIPMTYAIRRYSWITSPARSRRWTWNWPRPVMPPAVGGAIAPQDGDIVVRKVRGGPFGTTDLHDQLQATLILAGLDHLRRRAVGRP